MLLPSLVLRQQKRKLPLLLTSVIKSAGIKGKTVVNSQNEDEMAEKFL